MDKDKIPENVESIAIAPDGGTLALEVTAGSERVELFVDNRINTTTPGGIYTAYPGSKGAEMLPVDSTLVKGIKRFLEK